MVAGQLSPWYNVPRWSIETGEKLQHGCWSSSRLCWTIMGGGRGSRACKGMCEWVCEFEVCVWPGVQNSLEGDRCPTLPGISARVYKVANGITRVCCL